MLRQVANDVTACAVNDVMLRINDVALRANGLTCLRFYAIIKTKKAVTDIVMIDIWTTLYNEAKSKVNPREISPFIEAGGVAAAILTDKGNIYTGVSIDTACTLGMCAERNAIANMITNGENKIVKLVCVMRNGNVGFPCGACREYLMQLDKDSSSMEILKNYKTHEVVTLGELLPNWWGGDKFK